MQINDNNLIEMTKNIWNTMLEMELKPFNGTPTRNPEKCFLTGCVSFSGEWVGAVSIMCSKELANSAAGKMFAAEPNTLSDIEIRDALGELVNMLAGKVKTLIPGQPNLSIPSVAQGTDYLLTIAGGELVNQVSLECEGQPMVISLFQINGKVLHGFTK